MKKEFTRNEIYDLVWEKPFVSISKEYQISDNGLRKICKKYQIPYPKHGHWQKVKYGYKVKREKMKEVNEWKDLKIKLSERTAIDNTPAGMIKILKEEIELKYSKYLTVPEKMTNPDLLIKEARKNLSAQKGSNKDKYRRKVKTSSGIIDISVSKDNVKRALNFMNTIIRLIKKDGHRIEIKYGSTNVIIDGVEIAIFLSELYKKVVIKDEASRYGFFDETYYVPTGIFIFSTGRFWGSTHKDGKSLIEDRIAKIYAGILYNAREEKECIERNRIIKENAEKERQERIRQKAEIEKEKKKFELLNQHTNEWNNITVLRNFIKEVEDRNENGFADEWLLWAKERVRTLDPFHKGIEEFISSYDIEIDMSKISHY